MRFSLFYWNNNNNWNRNPPSHRIKSKNKWKGDNFKGKFNNDKSDIFIEDNIVIERNKDSNDSSFYNRKETKEDTKNVNTDDCRNVFKRKRDNIPLYKRIIF